ncbi:hypothetical protein M2G59_06770 [Vibrio vulnificus]|uniref:hypothetical protein n=1 Tax=Vibrio vulnificus TaxID=672 RepID=UPI0021D8E5F1|nr:hypothetical protein [Vibrio vulnificus]EHH2475307.1 hypothetical protein [Vibrio vulnificus]EJE8540417.1 hypothetical protein [Vibrio vulnificus]EKA7343413.1 hypothetical protein [Vibrio vulnificus]EKD9327841.1 hypothetical protein [Vibrio vulnificus]
MKVFYSWQSDTEAKFNRHFQLDCLKAAVKQINRELELDEPLREDHDTKGVAGSPDIASTILSKIENCEVFLADITFVCHSERKRALSNPNVLIELGYAMHALGSGRVINIMNTAFGHPEGNIPFDLAHKRWPITYNLNSDNLSEKNQVKRDLIAVLVQAIKPFAKQRKVTKPTFESNVEKIKHQEEFRKKLGDYIQNINNEGLRRRVIVRDIDRIESYPEVNEDEGISPWFKVELAQLYHKGVQVFLRAGAISLCEDGTYRFRDHSKGEKGDERVFLIGEIPFSNIVTINFDGDEYDYFPHVFCHFSEPSGEPYERLIVCKEIEMGNGHKYYSEISTLESIQKNSEKYGVKYFA